MGRGLCHPAAGDRGHRHGTGCSHRLPLQDELPDGAGGAGRGLCHGRNAVIEVRDAPRESYPWIAKRAGIVIDSGFRALEAVEGPRILGMVGYDGWMPNSCAMHVAIEEP